MDAADAGQREREQRLRRGEPVSEWGLELGTTDEISRSRERAQIHQIVDAADAGEREREQRLRRGEPTSEWGLGLGLGADCGAGRR